MDDKEFEKLVKRNENKIRFRQERIESFKKLISRYEVEIIKLQAEIDDAT